jgi:flagellar biosynthesis/type III secretory pathway protein FliH
MSNKFSIEIIEAPKQTSIDWLIDQLQKTRDYQRVINEANQSTTSVRDVINQAREMYQDEIEAAAIISSAEQSTKAANQKTEAFAIGYDQGYNRALDLVEWKIKNELKNTK